MQRVHRLKATTSKHRQRKRRPRRPKRPLNRSIRRRLHQQPLSKRKPPLQRPPRRRRLPPQAWKLGRLKLRHLPPKQLRLLRPQPLSPKRLLLKVGLCSSRAKSTPRPSAASIRAGLKYVPKIQRPPSRPRLRVHRQLAPAHQTARALARLPVRPRGQVLPLSCV